MLTTFQNKHQVRLAFKSTFPFLDRSTSHVYMLRSRTDVTARIYGYASKNIILNVYFDIKSWFLSLVNYNISN